MQCIIAYKRLVMPSSGQNGDCDAAGNNLGDEADQLQSQLNTSKRPEWKQNRVQRLLIKNPGINLLAFIINIRIDLLLGAS